MMNLGITLGFLCSLRLETLFEWRLHGRELGKVLISCHNFESVKRGRRSVHPCHPAAEGLISCKPCLDVVLHGGWGVAAINPGHTGENWRPTAQLIPRPSAQERLGRSESVTSETAGPELAGWYFSNLIRPPTIVEVMASPGTTYLKSGACPWAHWQDQGRQGEWQALP